MQERPRHPDWQYLSPEARQEAEQVQGGDGWYSQEGVLRDGVLEALNSENPQVQQQARNILQERLSRLGND